MKKTKINEEMRFSKSDTIYKKKYYDRMLCSANKKKSSMIRFLTIVSEHF